MKAKKDELIVCKDAKNGKGDIRVSYLASVSESETSAWKRTVIALGFRGTLGKYLLSGIAPCGSILRAWR